MKKILSCILAMLLCACGGTSASSYNVETSKASVSLQEFYPDMPQENNFTIIDKEDLKPFIEHGTGILFLGFPECPWCQVYLPMAQEILSENGAMAKYYNIYTDKKEDRPFYDEIAALIAERNDTEGDYVFYDNDGKQVIYMPLMLFIDEGEIVAFDNETCMEDSSVISPEEYWTQEKIDAFKKRLRAYVEDIFEEMEDNDAKGCDKGCEVFD